jgi:hypothetical protein
VVLPEERDQYSLSQCVRKRTHARGKGSLARDRLGAAARLPVPARTGKTPGRPGGGAKPAGGPRPGERDYRGFPRGITSEVGGKTAAGDTTLTGPAACIGSALKPRAVPHSSDTPALRRPAK